jgi:hypothetical protein
MEGCYNCGHLDKARKKPSNKTSHFLYGCNNRGTDGYICGWVKSDSDLKSCCVGCSDWISIKTEDKIIPSKEEKNQIDGQLNIMDWLGM